MLVLRRRPHEAIVFDGGLILTLASVSGRIAWLSLTEANGNDPVVLGLPSTSSGRTELFVRGPRSIERSGETTVIETTENSAEDLDEVLRLTRSAGDVIAIGTVRLAVSVIEGERAYIELQAFGLPCPVTLSIVSVSTVDARIGVDAPSELRVYRKEVWDEMQLANTEAAGRWSEEDLAALASKPR